MSTTEPAHFRAWPKHLSRTLTIPETSLWVNLEISARRYPKKAATIFYDSQVTYAAFAQQAEAIAGYLQRECGVARGDRVLLDMQNCPQYMLAFYAILRADAIVVPVSPMNVTDELEHYLSDSGAHVAIVGDEVVERLLPLTDKLLTHVIAARYADYLTQQTDLPVPEFVRAAKTFSSHPKVASWSHALALETASRAPTAHADDLAAILYTSGTTGRPKGCMHTHRTIMHTTVGGALWEGFSQDSVALATAPFFHVTGMQHSMNASIYSGATVAILPRWDPATAGYLIERYRCTHWANVPTMVVDLLAHPDTASRDLSSLQTIFGGGASMPEAVAAQLFERCGVRYMEAYGMTETISQTHINPHGDLRRQCLGIPTFDTESLVVDPSSLQPVAVGETGEIVSRGPQLMTGYWNNPEATRQTLVTINGHTYLRTGDLGRMDSDGFFYIADRLKRMINASGYKVWPAEVEATLYNHPDILEVAIVSAPDDRRGETVKAYIALKPAARGKINAESIITWSREHLAAYKVPRAVVFLDALPRSPTGKIQWRALQEREWSQAAT